jgi:hypothetical protein
VIWVWHAGQAAIPAAAVPSPMPSAAIPIVQVSGFCCSGRYSRPRNSRATGTTSSMDPWIVGPWVYHGVEHRFEVLGIPCDQRQAVDFGGCRDNRIRKADWPAYGFAARRDPSAGVGDRTVDRKNPTFEAQRQLGPQPSVEPSAPLASGQAFDPVTHFGKRNDTEENSVLVSLRQPSNNSGIRTQPYPFRHQLVSRRKLTA